MLNPLHAFLINTNCVCVCKFLLRMTFRRRLVDAIVFEGLIISWMKCTGNTHLHEINSAVEVPEDLVPERAVSSGCQSKEVTSFGKQIIG